MGILPMRADAEPSAAAAAEPPAAAAVDDNFATRTRHFFDLINDGNIQQLRVLIDSLDADELNTLLRRTVDPVERVTRTGTALWSAIFKHHFDIVDLLLEKGADPNEPAIFQAHDHRMNLTPLYSAVLHANLDLCRALIDRGANIDLGTDSAVTPLMIACDRSQTEIVTFLVENGANINLQTGDGATALMYASYTGNVDTVRLLLSHGANVEQTDYTGGTLSACGRCEGWQFGGVPSAGGQWAADVNQQTDEYVDSLMAAAGRGHLTVVDFLIEHGADLQHADVEGYNALMWAVEKGRTEMARHLIIIGAGIHHRNIDGKSARELAEESGNAEMVDIFRATATDIGRHAEGIDGQQNDQQQQQQQM
ncbi:hypothetical protein niasHS_015657 [Heterodera schachtii]|uniref:Uncharacterized protein n=1 Tax=Heterodera schachtii TaxID=97005 RepID=A0ABD2HRG1_HETSC